jgi:hypothetical protein
VTGIFWGVLTERIQNFNKAMRPVKIISGVFLIAVGVLMMFGRLALLNGFFQRAGYAIADWARSDGRSVRLIPAGIFLVCAFIPFAVRLFKKRDSAARRFGSFGSFGSIVWTLALTLLAAANGTGLINSAGFLARWLASGGV